MSTKETDILLQDNRLNKIIGAGTMFFGVLLWMFWPSISSIIYGPKSPCGEELIVIAQWVNLGMPATLVVIGFLIIAGQNMISIFKKG